MEDFDPYRKWLGIPPQEQPPNYYRLLGLSSFESDKDVIANASDRLMAHLRTFQSGKHSTFSQKILNEIAAARICLLDPKKREQYDAQLRAEIEGHQVHIPPFVEAPPIIRGLRRPGSPLENSGPQFAAAPITSPVAPYHLRQKKNRWHGTMVTLVVAGIGMLIACSLLYLAREEHWFEPPVKKESLKKETVKQLTDIEKNSPEKPPKSDSPPTTNPPSKDVRPSTAKTPAEIAAENEKTGKRMCFIKGNWREGLPMLAASANEELKRLAQKELTAPEDKADRLALADGWWTVSEKYRPPADEQIRRHAVEWYQKVVSELEDSDRDRAEWRISQEMPLPRGEKRPVDPDKLE